MDKNWLIRTKSNHILGPVSKEKVLELYQNGSIKPDDEVCSGNGYWFYIREDEMVSRFLLGSEVQSFNPISEAKDVLTSKGEKGHVEESSDITLVGGINLSGLKKEGEIVPPVPDIKATSSKSQTAPAAKETVTSDIKKKNNVDQRSSRTIAKSKGVKTPSKPLRKQDWLKYLLLLGFAFLLALIYFRDAIITHFFQGEVTSTSFSIMSDAHAQEVLPEKKKTILESSIALDKLVFNPVIGLQGFRVETTFNVEEISCSDLNNDVYQLGVVLYPPEKFNEKFLIKLRDCVLKLPEGHPVKSWLKDVALVRPLSKKDQKSQDFVKEILNSQFNLITDLKIKNDIIAVLNDIPENTVPEQLLKSYLYLMIGNIARSDNILKDIITAPPRVNWEKSGKEGGVFHKIATEEIRQLFAKLGRHPADRKIFHLFVLYLQSFYNDPELLALADSIDTSEVESKLNLKIIETISPSFIHFLRLSSMNEAARIKALRGNTYSFEEQSYWFWAFLDIDPLISDVMVPELERLEKADELWFIYLMENEKLADLYSRKGGSFLPKKRPFLKAGLNNESSFMMSLYKLIELGDLNEDLVIKTTTYLIHD